MISSVEDRKVVENACKEISNSMLRRESEAELIKEIVEKITDQVDIDKKHLKKLAAIYHRQNYNDVKAEADDSQGLYEEIFGS